MRNARDIGATPTRRMEEALFSEDSASGLDLDGSPLPPHGLDPRPPRCAPRAIRDRGAVPKSRGFSTGPSAESAPRHPVQPVVSTRRKPGRDARRGMWICPCIFRGEEGCAG